MEVNWLVLTYIVVGLFALSGFFRGWWKEGITTGVLILLLFLLQQPWIAQGLIDLMNWAVGLVWSLSPEFFSSIFDTLFAANTNGRAAQADPSDSGTWLLLLVLLLTASTLIGRASMGKTINPLGSVLGGLVGALNGFLVISLVREYIDGRGLPGGGGTPATEIAMAGGSSLGTASSGLSAHAVAVPSFTIMDSLTPWIIMLIGLFIVVSVVKTGFGIQGVKISRKIPAGYK
jgi:hypothetical protein